MVPAVKYELELDLSTRVQREKTSRPVRMERKKGVIPLVGRLCRNIAG